MPDSHYAYHKSCPACGAANRPLATTCWMCVGTLQGVPLATTGPAEPLDSRPQADSGGGLTAFLLGVVLSLVAVGLGGATDHWSVGIAFGVVIQIVFWGIAWATHGRRFVRGKANASLESLAASVSIMLLALLFAFVLLPMAALIALFVVCSQSGFAL